MNRIEFDKLDKFEQINYINNQLKKSGLTLTKICEKIGISDECELYQNILHTENIIGKKMSYYLI